MRLWKGKYQRKAFPKTSRFREGNLPRRSPVLTGRSRGRVYHLVAERFQKLVTRPALQVSFSSHSITTSRKFLRVEQTKRSAMSCGFGASALVFRQAALKVVRDAHIEPVVQEGQKHIDAYGNI